MRPAWLATGTMADLDPEKKTPDLVYLAAHLALRQMAREICRKKFDPASTEAGPGQGNLFSGQLQTRYPAAHKRGEDPEYVVLDHLTAKDVKFNVRRLRREAGAKLRHADALEAWGDEQFAENGKRKRKAA
ncbi:MAG: hypothetical protein F4092_00575 [Rhodospirillaceae bacterium]|nr:hypothetical protein [Rhodospirillaceae bacterium]MYJ70269.1 hypothetical protein [Rhodospirillaceae bacterium]